MLGKQPQFSLVFILCHQIAVSCRSLNEFVIHLCPKLFVQATVSGQFTYIANEFVFFPLQRVNQIIVSQHSFHYCLEKSNHCSSPARFFELLIPFFDCVKEVKVNRTFIFAAENRQRVPPDIDRKVIATDNGQTKPLSVSNHVQIFCEFVKGHYVIVMESANASVEEFLRMSRNSFTDTDMENIYHILGKTILTGSNNVTHRNHPSLRSRSS